MGIDFESVSNNQWGVSGKNVLGDNRMPVTIRNVSVMDLFEIFQTEYDLKENEKFTITFELKKNITNERKEGDDDFDVEDVGVEILSALDEVKAHREGKLELPAPL